MSQGVRRRLVAVIAGAAGMVGMAALAPAASASISPTISVTTNQPVQAGGQGDLGLDLKFNPTGTDGPASVALNLPPGVLADAAIDNGACISTPVTDFSNDSACQIGSGVVTAIASGVVPVPTPVDFYLVPPPAAGELAGLAVATGAGDQVGSVDGISIRPSGSADGVGVTLDLTLPNSIDGAPVGVSEIDSTFTGIRFPATCPSTPADITLSANSYQAPGTTQTAAAPLAVAGCSSLAFTPSYSLTAQRDAGDKNVALTTTITEPATDSPALSDQLAFPLASLSPSIGALHALCSNPASGTCTPVATVQATSPDYPATLTGQGYLTGSLSGLSLTLVFPAPFPLTLVGTVDLKDNTTTFSGLPDIPLTDLVVKINGGTGGLFDTDCHVPSGTSQATIVSQSGQSASPTSAFTIAGCPASSSSSSGSSSGSGSSGSGSSGSGSSGSGSSSSTESSHLRTTTIKGLKDGKPSLRFTLIAGRRSNIRSFQIHLPSGLALRTHRVHQRLEVRGLSLKGARLRSLSLHHGVLTVTLKRSVHRVTTTITSRGLRESRSLREKIAHRRIKRLTLTVVSRNSKGRRSTIHAHINNLG